MGSLKNVKSACRTFLKVRNSIEQKDGFTEKLKLDSSYFKGFGIGSESTQLMGGYGEKFEVMLDLTRIGIV